MYSSFFLRKSITTSGVPVAPFLISASVELTSGHHNPNNNNHNNNNQSVHFPQSSQFRFPFIDLLGDGYSTFSYIPTIFVSNNLVAIAGTRAYAEQAIVSTFNPAHDPYASSSVLPGGGDREGSIYFDVFRLNMSGPAVLNTTYRRHPGRYGEVGEYPLSL